MPMATTPTNLGVFENIGFIELAETSGQQMKKMAEKKEKAINDRVKSFHETSYYISFLPYAFKVVGFYKKGCLAKVDKSV